MAHERTDLLTTDIDAYLDAHEHKSMLRFITCGSVDDGKSTLIGRLLWDTKAVKEDQAAALERDREAAFHAMLLDPLTAAVCSPAEIRAMTDELFEAEREFLPGF